jgi:anionic cell wall polymer biosynthesis LytR-Cps2A-Psr (LCP) family protein
VITGSGSLAGPVSANEFQFRAGPWVDLALGASKFIPALGPIAEAVSRSQLNYSGKLTVLLLGSDWRSNSSGERLDTIMVMSIDANKRIKAVSIPRDSARIPIAPSLGGGTYNGKINGMIQFFKNQAGGNRNAGLARFQTQVAFLLGIKIDYLAYVRFDGFDALVDKVGGVPTNIPNELRDPKYIDKPGWPTGAKFRAASSALLKGGSAPRCYGGYPKPVSNWSPVMNCTRAIVYVRSRKGKLVGCCTNNDYKRAARQQKFVFDAIKRVTDGYTSLPSGLRPLANSRPLDIYTTIPSSSDIAMWNKLNGSSFNPSTDSRVFSPTTYASRIRGTSSNQLNLTAIRKLCDTWFDAT